MQLSIIYLHGYFIGTSLSRRKFCRLTDRLDGKNTTSRPNKQSLGKFRIQVESYYGPAFNQMEFTGDAPV